MLTIPRTIVVAAILLMLGLCAHAAVPRYQWRLLNDGVWVRIDRWTGTATPGFACST